MNNFPEKTHSNSNETVSNLRKRKGVFASVIGVGVNVTLAFIKVILGILTNSIAIIADSVNNFTDVASSSISLISFKISSKPRDRKHPFGHSRIEYISSLTISMIIIFAGIQLLIESLKSAFTQDKVLIFDTITFIVLSLTVVVKLALGIYFLILGKKINSSVISATSQDCFIDVLSTLSVIICSLIIKYTSLFFIDSVVGCILSILIFISGLKILIKNTSSLLGEAPVSRILTQINDCRKKYTEILGVHDVIVHNYGPEHYFVTFHAEVDGDQNIYVLHNAIDELERELKSTYGIECTIHLDPVEIDNEKNNQLKDEVRKCIDELFYGCDIHDFRSIVTKTYTKLIFDVSVPYENKSTDKEILNAIEYKIKSKNKDYIPIVTVDRI